MSRGLAVYGVVTFMLNYSRTSIKRPPIKRPPSIKRPLTKVPNYYFVRKVLYSIPLFNGCSNRRVLYIIEDTSEDTDIRLTHCIIPCAFCLQ